MKCLLLPMMRSLSRDSQRSCTIQRLSFSLFLSFLPISVSMADSGWQLSPLDIMGSGIPGFTESGGPTTDLLTQNPTPSTSSYRWYAQRSFSSHEVEDESAGLVVHFQADGHHTLEIWAGEGSVRSTRGFEKLLETRDTFQDEYVLDPRPEWKRRGVTLKVILKKDHNVAIESRVLRLRELQSSGSSDRDSFRPTPLERIERSRALKLGAFNIQVFGASKARKDDVMEHLVDILTRYDIALIQEIRDRSGTAIVSLLARLNAENQNDFAVTLSERHGSTEMKEQYAYLYRRSKVELLQARTYPDPNHNFERPPYIAHFEELQSRQDFALIGVHVDPDEAYDEIESLDTVSDYVARSLREPDIAVWGDFNADCIYLRDYELEELPLYYRDLYTWQIDDDADTTTGLNTCAYDRIVTRGEMTRWTKKGSVYQFDKALRISRNEVRRISDHYPVELDLVLPMRSGD